MLLKFDLAKGIDSSNSAEFDYLAGHLSQVGSAESGQVDSSFRITC